MGARVPVDDFSVMTGLTRDELREYRYLGLLEPSHTDAHTGYRLYDTSQVDLAHSIRRLRSRGMAIADLKGLFSADDLTGWRATIAAQHSHAQPEFGHVRDEIDVLGRRGAAPRSRIPISIRRDAPMSAWAVSATVSKHDLAEWITASWQMLSDAGHALGVRPGGPCAGLFERELFTQPVGRASILMPVDDLAPPPAGISACTLPPVDVAVAVHRGRRDGIDQSYGFLGAYVCDHLESDDGPIREYYLDGPTATRSSRTEICWPIYDATDTSAKVTNDGEYIASGHHRACLGSQRV
jgi:DNA-binding transcriptional MerR regulator/effector-binding domain-containing protein